MVEQTVCRVVNLQGSLGQVGRQFSLALRLPGGVVFKSVSRPNRADQWLQNRPFGAVSTPSS